MALKVDSCLVLLVMTFGSILVQMQIISGSNTTTIYNVTGLKNGTNSSSSANQYNATQIGGNQKTNGTNAGSSTSSTNWVMWSPTPASNDNPSSTGYEDATLSVNNAHSSSSSSMMNSFKHLLLVFMALNFQQMIP